jgi:hypothetical protein
MTSDSESETSGGKNNGRIYHRNVFRFLGSRAVYCAVDCHIPVCISAGAGLSGNPKENAGIIFPSK